MAEVYSTSLSGKNVSSTYKGLLHFPRGIDNTLTKQVVYDGNGTATSLKLGGGTTGADLDGDLNVSGSSNIAGNLVINGGISLSQNISANKNVNFNDVIILSSGSEVSLRTSNKLEASNIRIRESAGDFELIFGNPNAEDSNLFTFRVDASTKNLFVKTSYTAANNLSPFWINRTTGEVNIQKLKTDNIVNSISDTKGANSNRNTVMPGTVTMYASSAAPIGYHKCDGAVLNISEYNDLYSVIGKKFNTLNTYDDSLFFQVPLIGDLVTSTIIYVIKW